MKMLIRRSSLLKKAYFIDVLTLLSAKTVASIQAMAATNNQGGSVNWNSKAHEIK